jgi:hypothetical protein
MALRGSFISPDRPPLNFSLAARGRFSPPQACPQQGCPPSLLTGTSPLRALEGRR